MAVIVVALLLTLVPGVRPSHAVTGQSIGFARDVSVTEGDAQEAKATLTVQTDPNVPPAQDVTFTWCTKDDDGTEATPATAGTDYTPVEANTPSPAACAGAAADGASGVATIPGTATSTTIEVDVVGDDAIEGNETFLVVIDQITSSGGETIEDGQAIVTIEDDDPKISLDDVEVAEGDSGATSAVFTVSLSTPFPADGPDVVFGYTTADGSSDSSAADAESEGTPPDYQATDVAADDPSAARIPAGQTSTTVSVSVLGDSQPDGGADGARTEAFSVDLELPGDTPAFAGDISGTGTILDDDCRPQVVVGDATGPEGHQGQGTDLAFAIRLLDTQGNECATRSDLTIEYQTTDDTAVDGYDTSGESDPDEDNGTGGDYQPQPAPDGADDTATLTIPSGQSSGEIVVPLIGDDKYEDNENFQVTGIAVAADDADRADICNAAEDWCDDSPDVATGTITNDDPLPAVSVADVNKEEGSAFETGFDFAITLSNPSWQEIDVNWATADGTATSGDDYTSKASTVTFDPGITEATATVLVQPDDVEEPDETFFVRVSPNGDSDGAYMIDDQEGQATIVNDDGPQLAISDQVSVLEGDAGTIEMTFSITLSEARTDGKDVTVDVATADDTATETVDYEPESRTVTVPAGQTSAEVTVTVNGDTESEVDETFTVTLSNPVNAVIRPGRGQGVGEILDDDQEDGTSGTDPTAVIHGPRTGPEGAELTFDGSASSDPDGTVTEYAWAFSDGSPSARGTSVSHAFPDDGTYTVGLRVTDDQGAVDVTSIEVTVSNADPTATADGDTTVEVFDTATFAGSARDPGNDELTFSWDFGDGTDVVPDQTATHAFTEPGDHDVTLTATDDDGGADTDVLTVTVAPDSGRVGRHAGPDRVATSVAVSAANWETATDAVLATSGNYPDALAGGPLAAKLDAPLLLTPNDQLHDAVASELERLGVQRVWILGGTAAISQVVEDELGAAGYAVHRFEGPDRFVTAAVVAAGLGAPDGQVAIALGTDWPDALAAGAFTGTGGDIPTLLTAREDLPAATRQALEFMGAQGVFLIGGPAAISQSVEDQLAGLGYQVTRLAGANRYSTSIAVARRALERLPDDPFAIPVVFATGQKFPDGLAAAALTARTGGVLLLVPGTGNVADVPELEALLAEYAHRLDLGRVVGGTAVVTDHVGEQLAASITHGD